MVTYALHTEFCHALVARFATSAKLYIALGAHMDSQRMPDTASRVSLAAIHAFVQAHNRPPGDVIAIAQQLYQAFDDGKLTASELESALALFEADYGISEEDLLAQGSAVIKRQAESDLLERAVLDHARNHPIQPILDRLARVQTIGRNDGDLGNEIGEDSLDRIVDHCGGVRLSSGVPALNPVIRGGTKRGSIALVIAVTKGGKSMCLDNIAVSAAFSGHNVAFATLELSQEDHESRIIANITCLPIYDIETFQCPDLVRQRLRETKPYRGSIAVKYFMPKTSTSTIAAWVRDLEKARQREFNVVVIDYVDRVGCVSANAASSSSYDSQGAAMEELRNFAVDRERPRWIWTASQPKRRRADERDKVLTTDDVADSIQKVRIADFIFTSSVPEPGHVLGYIAGSRIGGDGTVIGPWPSDFSCGQYVQRSWPYDVPLL